MKTSVCIPFLILASSALSTHGAEAAANWTEHCAKCHGEDGKGDTKSGRKLDIADLTKADVQAKFTDAEAMKAVKEGVKDKGGKLAMKPIEGLSDPEIKALIAIVRGFKK
jgi:mono/diheme cytochrome c family protein